jgi:hypothetical protein
MKKQPLTLMLAAALLAACSGAAPTAPVPTELPSFDQATAAPKPTRTPFPTATVQPTVTVAPTATKVPEPTQLPIPDTPPTPIADEAYWAKFPKDEKGRVIGGKYRPIINYSPTMVTGKPCPRVTQWSSKVQLDPPPPDMPVAIPSNPCVIQNAIDDLVVAAWTVPRFTSPDMRDELVVALGSDPTLLRVLAPNSRLPNRESLIDGSARYTTCDQPLIGLIDLEFGGWHSSNKFGNYNDRTLSIRVLVTSQTGGAFRCIVREYSSDAPVGEFSVTERQLSGQEPLPAGIYVQTDMVYDDRTSSWYYAGFGSSITSVAVSDLAKRLIKNSPINR